MTNKDIVLSAIYSIGASDATNIESKAAAGTITDTEIIDNQHKIPQFDGTKDYSSNPVGFAVQDGDQVYGLIQPYNAASYPNQRPADIPAIWGLKHTKNPANAKPFVQPLGTSGMYMKDECVVENGTVYISLVDDNVYSPSAYPDYWREYNQ